MDILVIFTIFIVLPLLSAWYNIKQRKKIKEINQALARLQNGHHAVTEDLKDQIVKLRILQSDTDGQLGTAMDDLRGLDQYRVIPDAKKHAERILGDAHTALQATTDRKEAIEL